jgi:long-chain acyl-CoA synthetase
MGKRITFRELDGMVNRFARALRELGVRKGDRVAMILPNIPQLVVANLATWKIGAVSVLNNPLYTERELAYQLDDSDSKVVITLSLLVERVRRIMPETKVRKVVSCQINDYLPFPKKQLFPFARKEMYRKIKPASDLLAFNKLIGRYPSDGLDDVSEWESLSTIIYTGGTTGASKGVMLSNRNISCNVQQFRAWFPDLNDGEESVVGTFPIFHSAGFTACQNFLLWSGWEHLMVPRPEPGIIVELLGKYRPGFLPGVPTIFVGLLATPGFRQMDLSFIKGFFSGAAPLAADTIRDLQDLAGATILEVYGMTETTPIICITPWGGTIKPGTVGVPAPGTDIKVVDIETGEKELPTGEEGEIIVRGPQVMMGYNKKPDETARTIRDGWVFTGDIGRFDSDGYLSIVDRKKDMVIAGGYNIYPVEIDNVLFDHPRILEACAVGIPDEYRGETIKAFIVVKEGETLTAEEVTSYCKEHLAAYKVPKQVEFLEELPRTAVGKVLRRELKDREAGKGKGPESG